MSLLDFFLGIRDLLNPKAIARDLSQVGPGIRDLIQGLWNEEAVIKRNGKVPIDRVPTAEESIIISRSASPVDPYVSRKN